MILITRPRESALKLKTKLDKLNVKTFIEPLSKIKFINTKIKICKKKLYLISSPRVVDLLIQKKSQYLSLSFLIIGNNSSIRMRAAGFINILGVAQNSEEMLKIIRVSKKIKSIEYLTGQSVNKNFCENIKKYNINLNVHTLYQTNYIKRFSQKCHRLFREKKIEIVLIYSLANAEHILLLIREAKLEKYLSDVLFICLSKKIASIFDKAKLNAKYADKSSEEHIIMCIENNL